MFDVGLNFNVGTKWQTKAMPIAKWKELEARLVEYGYSVTWQQGLKNLYDYMDWINSCKLLVTQDSLGLHIGLALKRKIIGLFGPTEPQEIYLGGFGQAIYSDQKCHLMPCYNPECVSGLNCMEHIDIGKILEVIRENVSAEKPETFGNLSISKT